MVLTMLIITRVIKTVRNRMYIIHVHIYVCMYIYISLYLLPVTYVISYMIMQKSTDDNNNVDTHKSDQDTQRIDSVRSSYTPYDLKSEENNHSDHLGVFSKYLY
jgi:hypothetical protein